jgi:hypothetical protein
MSTTPITDILAVDKNHVVSYRITSPVIVNDVVVGHEYFRGTVVPGSSTENMPADIRAFCAQHHVPQVVGAFQAKVSQQINNINAPSIEAPEV